MSITDTTAIEMPAAVLAPRIAGAFSVEVDTLHAAGWNALLAEFDDASYDQTYCAAEDAWGASRVSHLLLRRDGVVRAAAQIAVLRPPVLRRGLAYLKFGPLWRRTGEPADPALFRAVVQALTAEYCTRRGHLLSALPRANPEFTPVETAILAEHGFLARRPMVDPNRYLVDVSLAPDELMAGFAQKWRYNLRKALGNGIEVRPCETEADQAAFAALHDAMVQRKRHDDRDSLHLIPRLSRELPARLAPRYVLAFRDGRPIAGAVVALLGDTAYYVFGASSDEALPLKAGYALHWWIANWLREEGVHWYDLGGEAMDPGLRQFKKGMVGSRGAVVAIHEYDRWTGTAGRLVADLMFGIREARRRSNARRERE